jgi:GLPGLI family protein
MEQRKQKLYTMKTKLLSLLCLTLLIGGINAQTFEGKLTFGIDYELPEAMEAQRSMLPSEMIIYIAKGHVRIEQKTMMGDQNVITDTKAKKTVLLMNMMGKKMAITMTDDGKEKPTPKIIYSKETKTIAGYECKKATYITKDEAGEDQELEVFYTEEIPSEANDKLPGLKGYPLEYAINAQGMLMTLAAKSVSKEKVSKKLFQIPEGYEEMSMEDFMKSMGQ